MRLSTIRLKTISLYEILVNNLFLIVIALVLLLLTFNYLFFLLFLGIYLYYISKKSKIILKTISLVLLIVTIGFTINKIVSKTNLSNNASGTIIDIEVNTDYQKITIKDGLTKTIVIDNDLIPLKIGYKIKVQGNSRTINPARIINGFDYAKYLSQHLITNYIVSNKITIEATSFSILRIKSYLYQYLDKHFTLENATFLKGILLANTDGFDEEFLNAIKTNGIIHLFAVSGLHIGLFLAILEKIYHKLKMPSKLSTAFNFLFLAVYLLATSFTPSILRVSLAYLYKQINVKLKLAFTSLDLQSLSFITLIIVNPFYMYYLGFLLSFTVAFTILVIGRFVNGKSNSMQILIISIFATLMTLPIVININYQINLLSPITNIIYINLVSVIILPLSIIVMLLPFLQTILFIIITSFEKLTVMISEVFVININLPHLNIYIICLYYLLLMLGFSFFHIKKTRYLPFSFLLVLLLILSNFEFFRPYQEVHFLDLYEGESIVILDYPNDCVVVIDTGTGKYQAVTTFLKSLGVKTIDALILTHNHNDHNGEAELILKQFKVHKIIVSEYDNSGYRNYQKTRTVSSGDVIQIGKIKFSVLNPSSRSANENDNSIVLYTHLLGYDMLLMGDATKNVEERLKSFNQNVDLIKIGHHGSATSSSNDFIRAIAPKIAIIQTGQITKFGFPNQSVITTLNANNVRTYRTDLNYSIKIKDSRIITTLRANNNYG